MNNLHNILYRANIPISVRYYNIIDAYYSTHCIGNISISIGHEYISPLSRYNNIIENSILTEYN